MTAPRPLRGVVKATMMTGRGSVLGPDTDRRVRWYELRLDCGHVVERNARYNPHPSGQRQRARRDRDALPAPKRVRCEMCPRGAA